VIPLGELLHDYLDRSRSVADFGGFMNLHAWLGAVGLRGWSLPASLVVFAATALWVHHRRRVDPWLLLGATAIVARLWTYHDVYDDVLMVFPLIALWRLIGGGAAAAGGAVGGRAPRVLLAAGALAVLVPSSVVRATSPLGFAASAADALVWLAILVFLVRRTSPRRMVDPEPAPATR